MKKTELLNDLKGEKDFLEHRIRHEIKTIRTTLGIMEVDIAAGMAPLARDLHQNERRLYTDIVALDRLNQFIVHLELME